MTHYYFDVYDGEQLIRDNVGQDLPSIQAAKDAAVEALPDIAREVLPDGDYRMMSIQIRFADGAPVLTATLVLSVKIAGH